MIHCTCIQMENTAQLVSTFKTATFNCIIRDMSTRRQNRRQKRPIFHVTITSFLRPNIAQLCITTSWRDRNKDRSRGIGMGIHPLLYLFVFTLRIFDRFGRHFTARWTSLSCISCLLGKCCFAGFMLKMPGHTWTKLRLQPPIFLLRKYHFNVSLSQLFQIKYQFWATICKTVRPMLSVRCLSVCPVQSCPVRLAVTLVYCVQTAGRIKMKLGIVLDRDPGPLPQRGTAPQFSAHICCG